MTEPPTMTIDDLNSMKLHEVWRKENFLQVICVPGGWIYLIVHPNSVTSTFVPRHYQIIGVDTND